MRTLLLALCLVATAACSSSPDGESGPERGGSSDSGRGGGRTDTGGTTDTSTEDADDDTTDDVTVRDVPSVDTTPADTGTSDTPIATDTRRDTPRSNECAQVNAVGDPIFAPIDIIWAIDTSGSMNDETALIETKLIEFVDFIEDSGLDVRVIMVAGDTVCVQPPLSGGGCPDADSVRYRHVRQVVGSSNAFEVLVSSYSSYSSFLRPDAIKHFVVVSDDESSQSPRWFRDQINALGLNFFVFHAIVSLESVPAGCNGPFCEGCSGPHGDAEQAGDQYILMSEMTGGTASSICEPDWTPIFEGIGTNVISGAALPCEYGIPDLGTGLVVDYTDVTVRINGVRLSHHTDVSGCDNAPGWYYDDNASPGRIHICRSVCGAGFDGDEIAIEFGCVKG